MRNPPGPYKTDNPTHKEYSKSGDSTHLAKSRQNFAYGGPVDYSSESNYELDLATERANKENMLTFVRTGKMPWAQGTAQGSSQSGGQGVSASLPDVATKAAPMPESTYQAAKPISDEDNPSRKRVQEMADKMSAKKTVAQAPPALPKGI